MKNISINNPRYYELRFMPIYSYEDSLNLTLEKKIEMIHKIVSYLDKKGIHVIFTDWIMDETADVQKPWEKEEEHQKHREIPIAELEGNLILINPRNIDFLSILFSIAHIYGHLVQRMTPKKYEGITRFLELIKPLNLKELLDEYKKEYGGCYKEDFLQYEIEAFQYAKYTMIEAGIEFNELLDHAMNVYLETDFTELWRWASESPKKSAGAFMNLFEKLFETKKGEYKVIEPKPVSIKVVPERNGRLTVVRDGENESVYL
jgi:hypothetical protein